MWAEDVIKKLERRMLILNVHQASPDNIEVTKKDTAKSDAENKNVSAHGIVTFQGVMETLHKYPSDQNDKIHRQTYRTTKIVQRLIEL